MRKLIVELDVDDDDCYDDISDDLLLIDILDSLSEQWVIGGRVMKLVPFVFENNLTGETK